MLKTFLSKSRNLSFQQFETQNYLDFSRLKKITKIQDHAVIQTFTFRKSFLRSSGNFSSETLLVYQQNKLIFPSLVRQSM